MIGLGVLVDFKDKDLLYWGWDCNINNWLEGGWWTSWIRISYVEAGTLFSTNIHMLLLRTSSETNNIFLFTAEDFLRYE